MPQIGTKGAELDLLIRQGATFGPNECRLTNPDGTPMNLTGASFKAQIRKDITDPDSTTIDATFTIVNALDGKFLWYFPDSQTALLDADPISEEAPSSRYVWGLEMQDALGRTKPLLYGIVKVFRDIIKD